MKVWIINHYAKPPSRAGGSRHFSFSKVLQEKGHQVRIFASNFTHAGENELNLPVSVYSGETTAESVQFTWLKTPPYKGNTIARFWNMVVFSRRLLAMPTPSKSEMPDIILGSSPHLLAASSGWKLARRYGCPFIVEIRDLWPETLVQLGHFTEFHPLIMYLARMERKLYSAASAVVTLLPTSTEYINKRGGRLDRIYHLPNGVNLPSEPPFSRERGSDQTRKFRVLYAGAHGLANDLGTIIGAAETLQKKAPEVEFVLIGGGPDKANLIRRASKAGLSNVIFKDPVPKSRMPEELQEADAFVILLKDAPLFQFGVSPNKLFDYLAAGRPVIFGINSSNNPVAEAKAGLTVKPGDPAALAEAVLSLSRMPLSETQRMARNGRNYVETNHDYRVLGGKLEEILVKARQEFKGV